MKTLTVKTSSLIRLSSRIGSNVRRSHWTRVRMTAHALFLTMMFMMMASVMSLVWAAEKEGDKGGEVLSNVEEERPKECIMNPLDGTCINTDNPEVENKSKTPLDKIWTDGTVDEIYEVLDCPKTNSGFRHLHDDASSSWTTLNRMYNDLMASKGKPSTVPSTFDGSGFQHPVEVRYNPDRGRGVFTKTFVPKGSLVWKGTNTATFDDAQDYRDFIRTLPRQDACEVLIWAYTRLASEENGDDEDEDEYLICVDLDEGSMVNSASLMDVTKQRFGDSGDGDVQNRTNATARSQYVNCALGLDDGPMPENPTEKDKERTWYGCFMYFYATKDIPPGTEIITDYDEFSEHAWEDMGL